MDIVVTIFLFLLGVAIYFVRPQIFFIYWISINPYILPVFYIPLKPFFTPFTKFQPILENYPGAIIILMLLFTLINWQRNHFNRGLKEVVFPLWLLFLFFLFQNILVGLDIRALFANIRDILWIIAPYICLTSDNRVIPNRRLFIRFIEYFVYIQFFFCLLNFLGLRIYGSLSGGFDDSLISGTFPRYNHLTDYLTIFFYIISYEYYEYKEISRKNYYILTILIGLMIILSGSRMSLLMYTFSVIYFIWVYKSRKVILFSIFTLSTFVGIYIIGNDSYSGQKADEGTGVERNIIGIVNLANSEDLSEGSTLELSALLLFEKLNSPLIGNGKVYRKEYYYGKPTEPYNNEGRYKVDARLAFMFVEYGVIGLLLFFYLYSSIFKGCRIHSEENNKYLYIGAFAFFFLSSITDPGFWDYVSFSTLLIYVYSKRDSPKLENYFNDR